MAEAGCRLGAVAIGRNEGERLVRCLCSLAREEVPVVYVDSASTDGSPAAARDLGAQVLALDMVRPFTAARARSEGLERLVTECEGLEYVLFVDGDCEVEAGFIGTALTYLDAHPDFAIACGRRRERFPEGSPYNALADAEWNTPVGEAEACGGDSVIRLSAYRAVGGFDAAMIAGEEPEMCARLRKAGWRIVRMDAPMSVHDAAMHRFGQWWGRAVRSGFGYAQAWRTTRRKGTGTLYARELARALFWAGVLPLTALMLGILIHPALVLIWPLGALAQLVRVARREGWFRARLAVAGKYAELFGALRYAGRMLRGEAGSAMTYK